MKIRYYKLQKMLKERHMTLEGLRQKLKLLPSDIAKIETNRFLGIIPNLLICKYFRCDTFDILEILPADEEEENELFYNKRILEKYSYTPKHYTKKEFASPI